MDCWNPDTFDEELRQLFHRYSEVIQCYFREDKRLMDEHLKSNPYESLKPNQHNAQYNRILEHILTPAFFDRSIRVWHYTRLLDYEVISIMQKIIPSTITSLNDRLNTLVKNKFLTRDEANIIIKESPFQSQENIRSNRFWSVTIPLSPENCGVKPLLESWGGESAYFWLSDEMTVNKLKKIGSPCIVEVETQLRDNLNAYSVAVTASKAWAVTLGEDVSIDGTDLAITGCIETADVLKVHTVKDEIFNEIGKTYPSGCGEILGTGPR